jgi:hypothetical protein
MLFQVPEKCRLSPGFKLNKLNQANFRIGSQLYIKILQLAAVYERILPQVRLRFLLADDPGAGKTIMAGLLLKELKLRNAVERVLILPPAPLKKLNF